MPPSILHELLVELFRTRPALAFDLLARLSSVPIPAIGIPRIEDVTVRDIEPTEYRADAVILHERNERAQLAAVVEVQLDCDRKKPFTWPLYAMSLRARLRIPVVVLVVTPDPQVAAWAEQPISVGGASSFVPIVAGPDQIPGDLDPDTAGRSAELAVLSALVGHPVTFDAARAAIDATAELDTGHTALYFDILHGAADAVTRAALEELMERESYQWQSPVAKKWIAKGEAEALLTVLDGRGIAVSPEQRERILACGDTATLQRWLRAALDASSADEVLGS